MSGSFGLTTFGDINPRVGIYAVARFLDHAAYVQVLERYALVEPLPKNKGQLVKWRRAIPFEINTTALVEGVTPAPNMLQFEDVSAVISQYGAWTTFTDVSNCVH